MSIDWNHFTPWASLGGGALIGLAAAMLLLLNGRVAGISGIVGGLLAPRRGEIAWRLAFVAGLLAAPALMVLAFGIQQTPRIDAGFGLLTVAGLLVGVGTSYGSGCTSGHGVCGLSRLSPLPGRDRCLHGRRFRHRLRHEASHMNAFFSFAAGLVFGVGLLVSGMSDPGKVIGFLDLAGTWDPSLAFVMGGAILVGFFAFRLAGKRGNAYLGGAMHLPTRRDIDKRLVGGSVVFGIGWGLAGFCPGPALVSLGAGIDQAAVFVSAMLGGMVIYQAADRLIHEPRRRAQHKA